MDNLFQPLNFKRGPSMKNRFMLAPLTNSQSHDDGVLSDDEFNWLTMRAKGGFGLTMTCAAHVQANGQGFPGQLGIGTGYPYKVPADFFSFTDTAPIALSWRSIA